MGSSKLGVTLKSWLRPKCLALGTCHPDQNQDVLAGKKETVNSWQEMSPYMTLEISFEPLWSISENGMCYVTLILLP